MYKKFLKIPVKPTKKRLTPKNYDISDQQKQTIRDQSYLGKKGYTIPKSCLTTDELIFLKEDLFMKPEINGAVYGSSQETAFPVFRENDKKIYIPRFYGISRYGLPPRSELSAGLDINVPFVQTLRDYQEVITGTYMNYVSDKPMGSGGILDIPTGRGKTVMALKIISSLGKKTLILVHKEFLMTQWIERIEEYLPSARVGKIQADVCDYRDKDIVLGMIQTIYKKEYPQHLYDQFGFTVIDEVHRIGSEEFSKSLLKIITPYMLGISATVERKDKMSKVLYMFIGDVIYSEKRAMDDIVNVRAIEYKTTDREFNEVEYDFRGNPKYSTMITKLCAYNKRTDFILRVITDLLIENPENQIMVLSHNRSILTYLYDGINHRKIGTTGYYVGGMKQEQRKETEEKQIVLATYAMASEGLDIKTLNTLIMITPKTDIVQSVGRILRMKHENPIIVDIVDSHDLFQKQWIQRRRYYKKCNYRIRYIDTNQYAGMNIDWETDKTWTWVYEPKPVESTKKDENNQEDSEENEEPEKKSGTVFAGKCIIDIEGL